MREGHLHVYEGKCAFYWLLVRKTLRKHSSMSSNIVIHAIYSVVEQSKINIPCCLTLFFFHPPDIIDNSKLITEECRKKVNGKPASYWFVVQTTVSIHWLYCVLNYTAWQDKGYFQILKALWALSLAARHPITNRSQQKYLYSC